MKPLRFCDEISKKFKDLVRDFEIDNTDFIRTSEQRHIQAVNKFWSVLVEKGHIYKAKYQGWYCVSDETFVGDLQVEDVLRDGKTIKVSSESGHPVEWSEEENYMFRLSSFVEPLKAWLEKNDQVIRPKIFHDLVLHQLSKGLHDISISRPSSRLHWGIPVPNDSSHTIYVWLDALVNYLTIVDYPNCGSKWPIDCHVIGKDILKFHAIYWPAFLLAAGLELPRKYICHSHWTIDDIKMSKSRGNVVDPYEMKKDYGVESLRYYLLREGVPHHDGCKFS